jgi:hypothetical protein
MSAFGRYCCKSLSGYEARNIDSSAVFTWQGRFKTLCAAERTLRREPIQLTFATVSARSRHSDEGAPPPHGHRSAHCIAVLARSLWRDVSSPQASPFDGLLHDAGSLGFFDYLREFGLSHGRSSFQRRYRHPNDVERS